MPAMKAMSVWSSRCPRRGLKKGSNRRKKMAIAEPREAVLNSAPRSSPEPAAVAYRTNDLGMEFVMVPAGEFQMGCSEGAKPNDCSRGERPRHSVQITKAFEIGKTELTQKHWQAVMGSNPSAFRGEDLPVEQVTFGQVQEFLAKLNAR